MTKYCGRIFNAAEMTQIRQLIIDHPEYHRLALSQHVCSMLQWYKPDGGLKEMSCRVVMLRMHADGLIVLPPPLRFPRPSRGTKLTEATNPCGTVTGPVRHLGHLVLRKVEPQQSKLWNEYVERYHYLGYMPLPGAQLRYFAMLGKKIVALLGFGAAAWQAAPRDNFIGWTHDQRERNLHLIINNARFLILPWIQIPNLASMILGMAVKQVPRD